MILAGTGHRPHKLGGYSDEIFNLLMQLAESSLQRLKPDTVISGMALGWDQALAQAAINLSIPFIAAVPFEGQSTQWPSRSKQRYRAILGDAEKIVTVSKLYSPTAFQKRNEWMVNNCDLLLALWDGSSGGTGNCIRYATGTGIEIANIWDEWLALSAAV